MLRPYQKIALDKIYNDLQIMPEVLLQGMMGCGKTFIAVKLVEKLFNEHPDFRFLLLMHKQELCDQFLNTFREFTSISDIGVCCAGLGRKEVTSRITIASIQTFINIKEGLSHPNLIIIDECHRIDLNNDSQYHQVINYLRSQRPTCRIFGITATPARLSHGYIYGKFCKDGAKNLFPKLNHKITYAKLLDEGFLVPLKGKAAINNNLKTDLEWVNVRGDYVLDELGMIMSMERHLDTAVEAIKKYCSEYKSICVFCCTIDHAEKLNYLLKDESTVIHSGLKDLEKHINISDWVSGKKRIICSVNLLIEGVDYPFLDCLVFARPTLSSTLFLQAVGRVLRPSPDKDHGFILDLTNNTERFGTDLDNIRVTVPKAVETKQKQEQDMFKICPQCEKEVHRVIRECDNCNFQWEVKDCVYAEKLPELTSVVYEEKEPVWYNVSRVYKDVHYNKKTDKYLGKITINYELNKYQHKPCYMFICMPDYYDWYPVKMSKEKWEMISDEPFPEDVEEFEASGIKSIDRILLDENKQYPEVKDIECLPF